MGIIKKIWAYFRKHLFLLFFAVVSSLFVAGTDGASAYILKHVLDDIFIKQNKEMLVAYLLSSPAYSCSGRFPLYAAVSAEENRPESCSGDAL
ncbi:MAG: hypothetical protein LRY51_00025 [Geovibrio sp.]|nr:hypothetical protein [Geovibrio sp.]